MFDNDKLQKNMMDMEYTQNRKELILHVELISACWHTLFIVKYKRTDASSLWHQQ